MTYDEVLEHLRFMLAQTEILVIRDQAGVDAIKPLLDTALAAKNDEAVKALYPYCHPAEREVKRLRNEAVVFSECIEAIKRLQDLEK